MKKPRQVIPMTFPVSLNDLRAMVSLASVDNTRYVLCGVHVEINGRQVLLVATDGRKLGVLNLGPAVADGSEVTTSFIIPRAFIESAAKVFSKAKITELSLDSTGELTIASPDCSLRAKLIDGIYPKWRQVIPRTKRQDGMNLNVNFEYLHEFKTACVLLSKGKKERPTVYVRGYAPVGEGAESPYTLHFARIPFIGVLMPITTRSIQLGDDAIPEWLNIESKP